MSGCKRGIGWRRPPTLRTFFVFFVFDCMFVCLFVCSLLQRKLPLRACHGVRGLYRPWGIRATVFTLDSRTTATYSLGPFLEKIVALVVNDDKCGKIFDFDLPHLQSTSWQMA